VTPSGGSVPVALDVTVTGASSAIPLERAESFSRIAGTLSLPTLAQESSDDPKNALPIEIVDQSANDRHTAT
jgi:hypothetical protein